MPKKTTCSSTLSSSHDFALSLIVVKSKFASFGSSLDEGGLTTGDAGLKICELRKKFNLKP